MKTQIKNTIFALAIVAMILGLMIGFGMSVPAEAMAAPVQMITAEREILSMAIGVVEPDPNEVFIQEDTAGCYFRLIGPDELVYDFNASAWAAAPTYAHSSQAAYQKTINRGWYINFPAIFNATSTAKGGRHILQVGFNVTPANTDDLYCYEFEWDKHNHCIVKGSLKKLGY